MSDVPTGLSVWNARFQAWNLMSELPTDLQAWDARSHESDVRYT